MIAVDPNFLGDLRPVDTYLYYDGPMSYSAQHEGRLFYCHQCDVCLAYDTFFVREASLEELSALEGNKITMRDFLLAAKPLYMVQVSKDHFKAFQLDATDFVDDHLPEQGAYLSWDQEDGK